MAPEVILGENYDGKADVYSFAILMFQVVTDQHPYPEFEGKINIHYNFFDRIIKDNMRPEFKVPVKDSLKKLITQCWSTNPKDRPTFEEIFKKLAYNMEESVYNVFEPDDEYKYYLDNVNVDEIMDYVHEISVNDKSDEFFEKIMNQNEELKKENQEIIEKSNKQDSLLNDLLEENRRLKEELRKIKLQQESNESEQDGVKDKSEKNESKQEEEQKENEEEEQKENEEEEKKENEEEEKKENEEEEKKENKQEEEQKENKQEEEKKENKQEEEQKENKQEEEKNERFPEQINDKTDFINDKKASSIIIGGINSNNQLGINSNNVNIYHASVIHPPQSLNIDSQSLLSYSSYSYHSVFITYDGSLQGVGCNISGQISSTLTKSQVDIFTKFSITKEDGSELNPISVVCTDYGTLYMFTKCKQNHLVYCDKEINKGKPVFLNIGNLQPVALFGGCHHAAAITNNGRIIFINRYSIKNSPDEQIPFICLPKREKASSVACLCDSVFVLSEKGRIFQSPIIGNSFVLKFRPINELIKYEIIGLSGTNQHCLAVTKNGLVFGYGSNNNGQLGINTGQQFVSFFKEITGVCRIKAVYAGAFHSLFQTIEGKVLACGNNSNGELLLNTGPGKNVYSITETIIKRGAKFCIAGRCLSVVFFKDIPPKMPNMRKLSNK